MKRLALWLALMLPLAVYAFEVNDASRAQLEQLDGVGVVMADKMLAERGRKPFAGWDDLRRRVSGIGAKRVQQWQAQGVTVNGERGTFTAVAPHSTKGQDR